MKKMARPKKSRGPENWKGHFRWRQRIGKELPSVTETRQVFERHLPKWTPIVVQWKRGNLAHMALLNTGGVPYFLSVNIRIPKTTERIIYLAKKKKEGIVFSRLDTRNLETEEIIWVSGEELDRQLQNRREHPTIHGLFRKGNFLDVADAILKMAQQDIRALHQKKAP